MWQCGGESLAATRIMPEGRSAQKDAAALGGPYPQGFSRGPPASPPEAGRRQLHQGAVRVAHIEARSAARPAIFARNRHAAFSEPLAPGVEIPSADRERKMQAPAPVMPRDHAASVGDVLFGRAGLKHQKDAAVRDLQGDEAGRLDEGLESEQVAIERRGQPKVARVERGLEEPLDRERPLLFRHRRLRTGIVARRGGQVQTAVQNARRPPTTASVPARIGRRTRSGTREAKWLEMIMPGIEPASRDTSMWTSTDPSHQCPAPAISVSGTACAISEPTMRTIGDLG